MGEAPRPADGRPGRVEAGDPGPAAREALRRLYGELDAAFGAADRCERCGRCCDFPESGHLLFAERLEALFALFQAPAVRADNLARGLCPFHEDGACGNRSGRPLGCRTYFCRDGGRERREALHELYLGRLRELAARFGAGREYRPFLDHLRDLCEVEGT